MLTFKITLQLLTSGGVQVLLWLKFKCHFNYLLLTSDTFFLKFTSAIFSYFAYIKTGSLTAYMAYTCKCC